MYLSPIYTRLYFYFVCVCKLYNRKYRRGIRFYRTLRKRTLIILLRRELTWEDISLIAFVCIFIRFPSVEQVKGSHLMVFYMFDPSIRHLDI